MSDNKGDKGGMDSGSRGLDSALDIETWKDGWEFEQMLTRFGVQVFEAREQQGRVRKILRKEILPRIKKGKELGVFKLDEQKMRDTFDALLFPGHVTALGSTVASHDSLALGINQIGIAVVSYDGASNTFRQTFYRKELATRNSDEVNEVMARLQGMHRHPTQRDEQSELFRRGVRAYAERAILLEEVGTEWLLGPGSPCSRDVFYALKYPALLQALLQTLRKLIKEHKKFVFVAPRVEEQFYLTIGDALLPGEYVLLQSIKNDTFDLVKKWEYNASVKEKALSFVEECCPEVIVGLFRVSEHTPPRLFYVHRDFAHVGAHLAMADSISRLERGFPMLLDVAEASCHGLFGSESFNNLINDAYLRAGETSHHFGER